MRNLRLAWPLAALLTCSALPAPVFAAEPAKVERLLEVMHSRESMTQLSQKMLGGMRERMMAECLRQGTPRARCEANVPQMQGVIEQAFAEALDWDKLRPEIVKIYADVLTGREVDAAVAHYSTPEGQALIAKLPELFEKQMAIGQRRMQAQAPKLEAELKA